MRVRIKSSKWALGAVLVAGILVQPCHHTLADMSNWESAVTMMKKGANQMVEGRRIMQQKKDLGSVEKRIKDGHRMMMEAEKAAAQIQKDTMKQGAKMMMDGFKALKVKNDAGEAGELMAQGQKMILEAEKMMADPRPEKLMQGSRTMMRGLRMMQERDVKTADKLMTDGQRLMTEAESTRTE